MHFLIEIFLFCCGWNIYPIVNAMIIAVLVFPFDWVWILLVQLGIFYWNISSKEFDRDLPWAFVTTDNRRWGWFWKERKKELLRNIKKIFKQIFLWRNLTGDLPRAFETIDNRRRGWFWKEMKKEILRNIKKFIKQKYPRRNLTGDLPRAFVKIDNRRWGLFWKEIWRKKHERNDFIERLTQTIDIQSAPRMILENKLDQKKTNPFLISMLFLDRSWTGKICQDSNYQIMMKLLNILISRNCSLVWW